jgi:hypothetical protein
MSVKLTKGGTINRVGAEQNKAERSWRSRCMLQCTKGMQSQCTKGTQSQCIHSGKRGGRSLSLFF